MKKIILSLAALMMLMAASVMTSCSNALEEVAPVEEVKENVVTLTIKMSEQAETRVGINDGTFKLTGWEENDVVKVYNVTYTDDALNISDGKTFKCTDPSNGTFTGTLNDGESLSDYNLAVYGPDLVAGAGPDNQAAFFAQKVSSNLEDVICLAGKIRSDGSCTMSICNNVLKVTNNGPAVDVAWEAAGGLYSLYCQFDYDEDFAPIFGCYLTYNFSEVAFTIPAGVSYVLMPPMFDEIGLVNESGDFVVEERDFGSNYVVGKLLKKTIGGIPSSTTGTAKATIGGSEVDVKWVQLWAGGSKFAEKNVGANSATEQGTTMTFTEAIAEGAGYVWGANWRTPSKDDMDELLKAATKDKSTKVSCEYTLVNGVYGFKFTGITDGYTENSVFFPAQDGAGSYGEAHYWSGTAANVGANYMDLIYSTDWFSDWYIGVVNIERLVRPVLKN